MQIKFCEYSYGENSTRYIWSVKSIVCGDAPKGSILSPHAWILIKKRNQCSERVTYNALINITISTQ